MAQKIPHPVAAARQRAGWSQAELADRAGLTRPAVSAIETGRVTPAVTAALALARALDCAVETLFAAPGAVDAGPDMPTWAIEPAGACVVPKTRRRGRHPASDDPPVRYWEADVAGRRWRYPTEPTLIGLLPHDGIVNMRPSRRPTTANCATTTAPDTLVIATCDPAVGLLAAAIRECSQGRLRLLPLLRTSSAAATLLAEGKVHAAGVHMAAAGRPQDNLTFVQARTAGAPVFGLAVADWQTGVVLRDAGRFTTAAGAARARLDWVGRDTGAGARRCLDALLGPRHRYRRLAPDHTAVATAVRCGWADAGVAPELTAVESQLAFLPVHREAYTLCLAADPATDWRLRVLRMALQSADYRRRLNDLPGCRAPQPGAILA